MSLLVHAFIYDETDQMQFVEKDDTVDLAGFESCRKNLYGSNISKQLGLKILPTLADEANLFIRTEDLQNLKREIGLMQRNLDLYVKEEIYSREYIEARLNNILNAIAEAQKIQGHVVIW